MLIAQHDCATLYSSPAFVARLQFSGHLVAVAPLKAALLQAGIDVRHLWNEPFPRVRLAANEQPIRILRKCYQTPERKPCVPGHNGGIHPSGPGWRRAFNIAGDAIMKPT